MTERQGIEIDYCPQCRGIWLDRGELDKIIERSQQLEINKEGYGQGSHYDHNGKHHDYYKNKKHKSFLQDLFD
jgi:Zn-finger nucleic acid-binding protein